MGIPNVLVFINLIICITTLYSKKGWLLQWNIFISYYFIACENYFEAFCLFLLCVPPYAKTSYTSFSIVWRIPVSIKFLGFREIPSLVEVSWTLSRQSLFFVMFSHQPPWVWRPSKVTWPRNYIKSTIFLPTNQNTIRMVKV